MNDMKILTTGGTIDKIYFDANSEFQVGEPQIVRLLQEANVSFAYDVESIMRKDSLDMTDADRALIAQRVADTRDDQIVITHGTDTMVDTATALLPIHGKTIVLTGAMQPARLQSSDAVFNIGCAVTAAQMLPAGIYIAMHGRVFDPARTRKNLSAQRFEAVE
ncbi:MAG: asparaginase [Pseudomonadales bacterium]|nr:asparaginase [Pseudomonadales bacterium]